MRVKAEIPPVLFIPVLTQPIYHADEINILEIISEVLKLKNEKHR